LRQYSSFIAGSAREQALIHQFRYACFNKWGVQFIIGFLPVILHLSLGLFMAGLVVFLSVLNHTIAMVVGCIAGFLFGAYITTNTLPILAIGCPYRTPLTPLLYSFVYGPGLEFCLFLIRFTMFISAIPYIFVRHALQFTGLLSWTPTRLPSIFSQSQVRQSLRQAEHVHVHWHEDLWTDSALSWLASTTSDPSAKIILVEALGTVKALPNAKPLFSVLQQQWRDISFLDEEPGTYDDEIQLGRLIRYTVTQLLQQRQVDTVIMLNHLPLRPIWVNDHSTILAIASCCRISTFHWANNRPLVLPPYRTFGFVIDHYAMFDQVIVPMWMWLSICVQTVGTDKILHSVPWHRTAILLRHVATSNTYNTWTERKQILAWLDRHHIPNDLQRAVDEKAENPEQYLSRYTPVSLAMFLVVMREGRSLDDYSLLYELQSRSIHSSLTRHYIRHSIQDLLIPSLPTAGPILYRPTIPETLAHPSSHPSQLPPSVQNDSAEGALPNDTGSSHSLQHFPENPSAPRVPGNPYSPGLSRP
jgi:hypothetical protein